MQKIEASPKTNSNESKYVVLPRSVVLCTSITERAQCMSNLMTTAAVRQYERGQKVDVRCTMAQRV
jgi:hypothetical protein